MNKKPSVRSILSQKISKHHTNPDVVQNYLKLCTLKRAFNKYLFENDINDPVFETDVEYMMIDWTTESLVTAFKVYKERGIIPSLLSQAFPSIKELIKKYDKDNNTVRNTSRKNRQK